jgi:hypothetical protein
MTNIMHVVKFYVHQSIKVTIIRLVTAGLICIPVCPVSCDGRVKFPSIDDWHNETIPSPANVALAMIES